MIRAIICSLALFWASAATAHNVRIDTSAGEAVLAAVVRADLTADEARRIARFPANRRLVERMLGYDSTAGEDRFITELVAVARDRPIEGQSWYGFEAVKRDRAAILRTVSALDSDRTNLIAWLGTRIGAFSPRVSPQMLTGYFIVGGRPAGFAFGGPDFYLNLARFPDDPQAVRIITAHELYHAVQGAALQALGLGQQRGFRSNVFAALDTQAGRDRYLVEALLGDLMNEGVATYVGDPMLLEGNGPYSRQERERADAQLRRVGRLTALLDMSLTAITSDRPMPYADVYSVGFFGPDQALYYLGYAMARAIARAQGDARLGILITGTGCNFARAYLDVISRDPALPRLGAATLRLIEAHCPREAPGLSAAPS
jgi:hypothetical protein